ncbi:uncharacterized protein ACA1_044450 [Acanthamoeba castellanii str. Neff]|uniref:Uncharacterized protein n=1 Tax=Acanthamoeba castellanii (strain ATCC 30010 / Neff) TaxID=1257118 RepID=L8GZN9_ACACF|nr:uncharacterized protein ACA1_044450 [Acanthamoeba castellanii str. Neff]ELR18465.1 hypothetical protein ACA1_044450 [Acanthamoeba castellanii str. Neff]
MGGLAGAGDPLQLRRHLLYANITFQFVSELDEKLFFVVSSNDIMPDGTWCVQQRMCDITADDSGKVTLHPSGSDAPFDVRYHNGTASSTWSLIYGTISGTNWDRIDMHSADGC